jgi:hypothetical protein
MSCNLKKGLTVFSIFKRKNVPAGVSNGTVFLKDACSEQRRNSAIQVSGTWRHNLVLQCTETRTSGVQKQSSGRNSSVEGIHHQAVCFWDISHRRMFESRQHHGWTYHKAQVITQGNFDQRRQSQGVSKRGAAPFYLERLESPRIGSYFANHSVWHVLRLEPFG